MTDVTPGPGHNSGAINIAGVFAEDAQKQQIIQLLSVKYKEILDRRDALIAAVARAPKKIEDCEVTVYPGTDDEAKVFDTAQGWHDKISETVKLMKKCVKKSDDSQKPEKAPYLAGGRAVDDFFKRVVAQPLLDAIADLEGRQLVYTRAQAAIEEAKRKEALRIAEEEAQRLKQIAEQEAAKAKTKADADN